ncbi:type II secretion system protein [Candidatus Roizmanbacteria bacterium]|nr:type II secretion system protein [Candidatus Roizmanbacteria bacterium]
MQKLQKGFTLVELLVVIGILAILTAVVLVAVNPGKQLIQARDTERKAEVNTVLSAVTALLADPNATGSLPAMSTCPTMSNIFADATGGVGDVDLSVVAPVYVAALPEDPTTGGAALGDTGYDICQSPTNNRFTVTAPGAEGGVAISVTR